MKKHLTMAGTTAFIFYPAIIVLLAIIQLFRNKSFRFMGFTLNVQIGENSANASLNIGPIFVLSTIIIFLGSLLIIYVTSLLIRKLRSN